MKNTLKALTIASLLISNSLFADTYAIDTKGAHASINFKISHLGYSWIYGRFNDFEGSFEFDEANKDQSNVSVTVKTNSVDSNHAERDKHLRSGDFLDADKFPEATFTSTSYAADGDTSGKLTGDLTLHGVTKPITIDVTHIGGGDDPWGGVRQGFSGSAMLTLADYGITKNLGPASAQLELILVVEGVKQ